MQKRQIIHRDIKPNNLLFRNKFSNDLSANELSDLCLVDFGLSTKKHEKPIFLKCGTPGYIAPELLKARNISNYSESVDMFSVGAILYFLQSGRSPFGESRHNLFQDNKDGKIALHKLKCMEEPYDLVKKMLMIYPEDRISINDALCHRFIEKYCPQPVSMTKEEENIIVVEVENNQQTQNALEKLEKFQLEPEEENINSADMKDDTKLLKQTIEKLKNCKTFLL